MYSSFNLPVQLMNIIMSAGFEVYDLLSARSYQSLHVLGFAFFVASIICRPCIAGQAVIKCSALFCWLVQILCSDWMVGSDTVL